MRSPVRSSACALVTAIGLLGAGCAEATKTTGTFTKTEHLGAELRRGASTKSDVERVLGRPNGRGMTLLPTLSTPREMWVYQNAEMQRRPAGGGPGQRTTVHMDTREQILFVFFDGERFDGYLWTNWVQTHQGGTR